MGFGKVKVYLHFAGEHLTNKNTIGKPENKTAWALRFGSTWNQVGSELCRVGSGLRICLDIKGVADFTGWMNGMHVTSHTLLNG